MSVPRLLKMLYLTRRKFLFYFYYFHTPKVKLKNMKKQVKHCMYII